MKNIIFDWSGVVRETVQSQLWIVNRIFARYGAGAISLDEFRENWEQPYVLFYEKYLPEGYGEDERAGLYREAAFDKECPKSFGIPEMLELVRKLKGSGAFLAIVSSDLSETLLAEIKEWRLEGIFNEVVTEADDKLEAVKRIIEDNGLDLGETCFIGDSNHEIDVARKTGIKSVAVTWGFTDKKKLKANGPDYIVDDPRELSAILI